MLEQLRTELRPRAADASTAGEPRGTYDKLESLRGVAACLVAFHHSPFTINGEAGPFVAASYLFVDMFFILSGFVMTHAYRDRILRGMSFKTYASLRLARLYPLHLFTHLLYASSVFAKQLIFSLGVGHTEPAASIHAPSFWTSLFLLQAFGIHDYIYWNRPSWSISAELGAYVAFFILTNTLDRAGRLLPPLISALLLYTGLLAWDDRRLDVTYDLGALRCLAGFYAGSFLYRLQQKSPPNTWVTTRGMQTSVEIATITAVAVSVACVPQGTIFVVSALLLFAVAIMLFSLSSDGLVGTLLRTPLLRKIGAWSYSIYLIHLLCFEIAENFAQYALGMDVSRGIGLLAIAIDAAVLAGIIVVSRATYRWIEKPFRDRINARLAPNRQPQN